MARTSSTSCCTTFPSITSYGTNPKRLDFEDLLISIFIIRNPSTNGFAISELSLFNKLMSHSIKFSEFPRTSCLFEQLRGERVINIVIFDRFLLFCTERGNADHYPKIFLNNFNSMEINLKGNNEKYL